MWSDISGLSRCSSWGYTDLHGSEPRSDREAHVFTGRSQAVSPSEISANPRPGESAHCDMKITVPCFLDCGEAAQALQAHRIVWTERDTGHWSTAVGQRKAAWNWGRGGEGTIISAVFDELVA